MRPWAPTELDARGRRLRAVLAAVLVPGDAPELRLMHDWLDNWSGLGLVVAGMTHQGWDVQLTAYAARDWRANFFPVGSRALRRRRQRVGADAVAGGAEGGVGDAEPLNGGFSPMNVYDKIVGGGCTNPSPGSSASSALSSLGFAASSGLRDAEQGEMG